MPSFSWSTKFQFLFSSITRFWKFSLFSYYLAIYFCWSFSCFSKLVFDFCCFLYNFWSSVNWFFISSEAFNFWLSAITTVFRFSISTWDLLIPGDDGTDTSFWVYYGAYPEPVLYFDIGWDSREFLEGDWEPMSEVIDPLLDPNYLLTGYFLIGDYFYGECLVNGR